MRNYFTTEALNEPCARNFIIAPFMGLLFLMFLPFIGFYLTAKALVAKMIDVASFSPPQVGNAYLTGSPNFGTLPESDSLSDIEKEVANRRK